MCLGMGPYDVQTCPLCGALTFNGQCEDRDCHHHWHPVDEEEEE